MDNNTNIQYKFQELWRLVGNTPMFKINFKYKGKLRSVYAKSEQYNITGSTKDRMALHIIEQSYKSGKLKPGSNIYEATSGNTGIAFSAIGRALGFNVTILMPDWMSRERVDIIRSLGAKIIPISKEEGGFLGSIKKSEELAAQDENSFLPCQFSNEFNVDAHYTTTAPEIWKQLGYYDIHPDAFVAGVGTGGTIMGVAKFLKEKNPNIKAFPLEPLESPTLTTGHKVGAHRIQGISDEFIPSIVKLDKIDKVVTVSDGDSILMAQKLAQKLGLAVGISSGANLIGAIQKQDEMGDGAVVATVFADCNKKYLSTDLLREEPVKAGYLTPDIELIDFKVLNRVCLLCRDHEAHEHKISKEKNI